MNRKFPRSPSVDPSNPFEDERGANPFGDSGAARPSQENPYGGPADSRSRPYQPDDFETIYASRPRLILAFAISGLVFVTIGMVISVIGVLTTTEWSGRLLYGVPFNLLGVAASAPAWGLGWHDRRAMKAGAMDAKGRLGTTIGYYLGIVGTLIGAAPVAGFFVASLAETFLF